MVGFLLSVKSTSLHLELACRMLTWGFGSSLKWTAEELQLWQFLSFLTSDPGHHCPGYHFHFIQIRHKTVFMMSLWNRAIILSWADTREHLSCLDNMSEPNLIAVDSIFVVILHPDGSIRLTYSRIDWHCYLLLASLTLNKKKSGTREEATFSIKHSRLKLFFPPLLLFPHTWKVGKQ